MTQTVPPPTDTVTDTGTDSDAALKARHRALWASGDYAAVASEVIADLGPILVQAAGVRRGQRVHDVAAGSGNVALPAARTGAEVVATDLTPELLAVGEAAAAREGLDVAWRAYDAERLPCDDGEYDVTLSCVGVMFAPHHQTTADQLVRVTRPGGTIGLINWTPDGFIGRLFAAMRPYAAAPPPGAQPPPLWGVETHVRELLGDRVDVVRAERRPLAVDRFGSGAEFRDFFKTCYGPTIAAYRNVGDDPDRVAELDGVLAALADDALVDGVMDWEYLLVIATVR